MGALYIVQKKWNTLYIAARSLELKKNQKKIKKPLTFMSKDGNIIKSPRDTATKQ